MEEYKLKKGESYTFNIYNNFFAQHLPIISTNSVGGTFSGEVSLGVTNVWQTQSGKLYYGNVVYSGTGASLEAYTNDGSLKEQHQLQKIQIIFTPPTTGTFYLNDVIMENVGVKLTVQDNYGDFLNPEEPYHTLIMRRSNRVYSYNYNDLFFQKFLNSYIPASLRARFTNLPPEIEGWYNNKSFYDPEDVIIISALISDPEDDILTHQWNFLGMRTVSGIYYPYTVEGVSMIPPMYNVTSITCSGLLPIPPVETLFRFQLRTSDSDNTTSGINAIPVYSLSGQQFRFVAWGGEDFCIGNADLPFSYYPDSGWVPELTKPVLYVHSSLTGVVTFPRGMTEAELELISYVYKGVVFDPWTIENLTTINYVNSGVVHSPDTFSGLSAQTYIGLPGPAKSQTQHSFELSFSTSVV